MNIQDIFVFITVFLCIAYTGKHFLGFFKKGKKKATSCHCGCSGCKLTAQHPCSKKKEEKK